ncbi:MAG TPA: L-threonylcarbamoyladenylate synthase [Syntrophorhabdaceae bacterium]
MEILDGYLPASIQRAADLLTRGELVAFPTETVYGLGADALNSLAVAGIFELKKRPHFDPLIIHIGEKEWLRRYARSVPPKAAELASRFWPGPLTLILEKNDLIPDIVTSGLPTVGIRMPAHPVALELIRRLDRPIAAPSANPFGYMSPTRAAHVAAMFKDTPLLILDGGDSAFGIESSIVSFPSDSVRLHRHGALTAEDLTCAVGPLMEKKNDGSCESPGELPYHYAPHKPLVIVESIGEAKNPRSSYLSFKELSRNPEVRHIRTLSPKGDLREAAANFFSFLIELDREDVDVIYAEKIPESGLGRAMMERLHKASRKYLYITR